MDSSRTRSVEDLISSLRSIEKGALPSFSDFGAAASIPEPLLQSPSLRKVKGKKGKVNSRRLKPLVGTTSDLDKIHNAKDNSSGSMGQGMIMSGYQAIPSNIQDNLNFPDSLPAPLPTAPSDKPPFRPRKLSLEEGKEPRAAISEDSRGDEWPKNFPLKGSKEAAVGRSHVFHDSNQSYDFKSGVDERPLMAKKQDTYASKIAESLRVLRTEQAADRLAAQRAVDTAAEVLPTHVLMQNSMYEYVRTRSVRPYAFPET